MPCHAAARATHGVFVPASSMPLAGGPCRHSLQWLLAAASIQRDCVLDNVSSLRSASPASISTCSAAKLLAGTMNTIASCALLLTVTNL